jgi:hypothetical protein
MAEACVVVAGLDFFTNENVDRPLALQALSNGEVQFYRRQGVPTLVELHLSPFEGWWLKRTAVVNDRQVLARKLPLPGWGAFYQLAPEDMVIHLAIHLAIGHQFGAQSVRTLVDIARLAFARDIDWQTVAARARDWRVATAVWLVLYHEQQLVGLAGLDSILDFLQPTHWRRQQLLRMVSEQSILSGGARRGERERYRLLLLLVDRSRDAGRLVFRTLWPEGSWLHARYGGGVGHWQHWQHLLREGRV